MSTNRIADAKTVSLQSETGSQHAIMIALEVSQPAEAAEFVNEVAERFKIQRTLSPPDTHALLITIIGALPATTFAEEWKRLRSGDEILDFYMSQMRRADVLRGTPAGQALESASLLSS